MNYQMLLLAHDAFYKFEPRANKYDNFMANKNPELWNVPNLPDKEVINLFKFIRSWDRFFTGQKHIFTKTFSEYFHEINNLEGKTFLEIDLSDKKVQTSMFNVFDNFAQCNETGNYESTAASKLAHAMNPELFIMWDTNIREGYLGAQEEKDANNYVYDFLPLMKVELNELLTYCIGDGNISRNEAYNLLEKITGNSVPKLIDQYNYMTFTMRTMFSTYISNISEEDRERMSAPFLDSIDYWKSRVTSRNHKDRKQNRQFTEMVSILRQRGKITTKEMREYNKRWKEFPEDRDYWFNYILNKLQE